MEIKITEIEQSFQLLMEKVKQNNIDSLIIDHDLFWNIDSDERTNLQQSPELVVNSLFDDINNLQKMNFGETEPLSVSFDWLGNVLLALGARIRSSDKPLI